MGFAHHQPRLPGPAISKTALALIVPIIAWQVLVFAFAPPRYVMPSPLDVLAALCNQPYFFAANALITLTEILLGLLFGAGSGVVVAVVITALPRICALVWPLLLVAQALPVFVLAPLLVVWFGFGMVSKVVMASVIIFFPVASAFADGIRRTDPAILDAAALTQATRWQTLLYLRGPLGLPALASGLRIAAPLAPLGAVIGEWVGASAGLGFVMVQANARMQTETVFAAIAIVATFSLLLRQAVDRLAPYLTPWAPKNNLHKSKDLQYEP